MKAPTEADVQRLIVQFLRLLNCTVLETSRRRKRCRCGRWPAGGDGVSKGLPDLFVWLPRKELWLGLEVKGPKTRTSSEQWVYAAAGMVVIVRSPEEALAAVKAAGA